MFEAQDLRFGYTPSRQVLKGVNVTFSEAKIYGLLGKNGEGKTTLLKLACGLRFAQSGRLDVLGHSPPSRPVDLLKEIFLLPEEVPIHPVSARRLAELRAPFYPRFSMAGYSELLREFEVAPEKSLAELSHGQRKKALLAMALATNCRLLMLDEPTNGLDIPSKSVFRRLVAKGLDAERCIIISTHQVRDVEDLIDSVAILDKGVIVFQASLAEVADRVSVAAEPNGHEVLYVEETAAGRRCLVATADGSATTRVDLEFLFNAAIHDSRALTAAVSRGRNS